MEALLVVSHSDRLTYVTHVVNIFFYYFALRDLHL